MEREITFGDVMKVLVYNNPVLSAIIIYITILIIFIWLINTNIYHSGTMLLGLLFGFLNRKILDNGVNIDKSKKCIIIMCMILNIVISIRYAIVYVLCTNCKHYCFKTM